MIIDYEVLLDLVIPNDAKVIETKQYDDGGRRVIVHLSERGQEIEIPSGATFTYSVSKPDKTFVKGDCDDADGYPAITLTQNMLSVAGIGYIDITMTEDGEVVSTMRLKNIVRPAAVQDTDVESTTEYQALEAALEAASDVEAAAESAREYAEAAEEAARTLTIDTTLTQSGQAADAEAAGNAVGELRSAFDGITENKNIASSSTTAGFYIASNGNSTASSSFNIKKYPVTSGVLMYLDIGFPFQSSGGVFQFQATSDIPLSNNQNIVGETYKHAFNGKIIVPDTAQWLMITVKAGVEDSNVVREVYPKEHESNNIYGLINDINVGSITKNARNILINILQKAIYNTNISADIDKLNRNLIYPGELVVKGTGVKYSQSGEIVNDIYCVITEYYPVEQGETKIVVYFAIDDLTQLSSNVNVEIDDNGEVRGYYNMNNSGRQNTEYERTINPSATYLGFTLNMASLQKSYAYFKTSGNILFAGSLSPYAGMKNIFQKRG